MTIYAQIVSAIFALMAAALWLGAAFVRTPRSFSVQVTTWHTHSSENVDGSETTGGGHGTSDELVTLGTALAWQTGLEARKTKLGKRSVCGEGQLRLIGEICLCQRKAPKPRRTVTAKPTAKP